MESDTFLLQYLLSSSAMLLTDVTVETLLERLVELACAAIPGCDHAGITLERAGKVATAAATDGTTLRADRFQYEQREGPSLDAMKYGKIIRIDDTQTETRFGSFPVEAWRLGIRSCLAIRLTVASHVQGSINIYSAKVNGFDQEAEVLAGYIARHAATALANAVIHERLLQLVSELNQALSTRGVIEQGKGFLMATLSVDAEGAFEVLRRMSQDGNLKLREVASDLLRSAGHAPPLPEPSPANPDI
jgi:GAF domain-containing protein